MCRHIIFSVMLATIAISSITFITIVISLFLFPRIHIGKISIHTYWIIALVGALLLICSTLVPLKEVFKELTADTAINPLKILVLFFSMTFISILLDEFGLFRFLASVAAKRAKNQYVLFFSFYFLVAALTIFTSNDVVILTFTPFICFFCKRMKINPIPYLISEFAAANTWSLLFIIGNPTNIFLGTSAGITFIDYVKVMALPTIVAGSMELLIIFLIFRHKLSEKIGEIDIETEKIENKPMFICGVVHLLVCLIFLVIANYIHIEMWLISLICATSLLVTTSIISLIMRKDFHFITQAWKRLPYPLIPFFLSMFIIVVTFNYQGISSHIASLLGGRNPVWVYGFTSLLMSNVINNIPMSILYTGLCSHLESTVYLRGIYASIIGSNIGAFLTPIGALAGIMFLDIVNKHEVKFSFTQFVEYGFVIAIPTITVALLILFLI